MLLKTNPDSNSSHLMWLKNNNDQSLRRGSFWIDLTKFKKKKNTFPLRYCGLTSSLYPSLRHTYFTTYIFLIFCLLLQWYFSLFVHFSTAYKKKLHLGLLVVLLEKQPCNYKHSLFLFTWKIIAEIRHINIDVKIGRP